MSIYIRGMEMPPCCYECPCISTADIGVGTAYGCALLNAMMYDPSKRLDDCPIIELPEHGDLIDKDALRIYQLEDEAKENGDLGEYEYDAGLIDGLHMAAKDISVAPVIIPASGGEET